MIVSYMLFISINYHCCTLHTNYDIYKYIYSDLSLSLPLAPSTARGADLSFLPRSIIYFSTKKLENSTKYVAVTNPITNKLWSLMAQPPGE